MVNLATGDWLEVCSAKFNVKVIVPPPFKVREFEGVMLENVELAGPPETYTKV